MVLAKIETTPGEDSLPTPLLNAVLVENPNSGTTLNNVETNEVTGALDARAPLPGSANQNFTARVYVHGSGTAGTVAPEVDPFLRACGMTPTALTAAVTGVAADATASTIQLQGTASAVDEFYRGMPITITAGPGLGQTRMIYSYNGTTKTAIVVPDFTAGSLPDDTSEYEIPPNHSYRPVSTGIPTATIYEYLFPTDNGDVVLRRHTGAAGTFTATWAPNEAPAFEFTMTGSLNLPQDVPQAGIAKPDYQDTRPPPFLDALFVHLDGVPIALSSLSYDANNTVTQVPNALQEFGLDISVITRRRSNGSLQSGLFRQAERDVFDSWKNGTESDMVVMYGSQPGNRIAILVDAMVFNGATDQNFNELVYVDTPYAVNRENAGITITFY
jgi:hypothetical protein